MNVKLKRRRLTMSGKGMASALVLWFAARLADFIPPFTASCGIKGLEYEQYSMLQGVN